MQEFEMLLCEHKGALERFVKFKVQNPYDAEDILQGRMGINQTTR